MNNEKKEFVIIQSKMNISVTPGLQAMDVTNVDAHVPDRLKINSLWAKAVVDIKQGVGRYPAYITEWNTVKALVKDEVLTIGDYTNDVNEEEKKVKTKLDAEMDEVLGNSNIQIKEKINKISKKTKDLNLDELAGE